MPGFLPCKCVSVGEEGASGSWVPCVHHGHTPGYSIFSSCSFPSSGLRRGPAPWSGAHTDIKFRCSVPLCQLGDFCFSQPCVTSLLFLAPWEGQDGSPAAPSLIFNVRAVGESEEIAILSEINMEGKSLLCLIFGFLYSRLLKHIWKFSFPLLCPGVPGRMQDCPFCISFFFLLSLIYI